MLLLDPLTVADSGGVTRAGTPLDSFIPERGITRADPVTPGELAPPGPCSQGRQRAAELEDRPRQRCEALRAETGQHHERLRAVEHTVAERRRVIDLATAALRSRAGVLDQVDQLGELIETLRARGLARLVTSGGCPRLARHRWRQRFTGWGCDHCPFGRKIKDLSMPNGQW